MGFQDIVLYNRRISDHSAALLHSVGVLTSVPLSLLFTYPECPSDSNLLTQTPPTAHACNIYKQKLWQVL